MIYIVIPIYNTSKYLDLCLARVCEQTYINWVCFLVDDGSTDDSAEICKKYVELDKRFRYIFQSNQGLSAARNKGIALAINENVKCDDYICFIDSDDYIEHDYLSELITPYQSFHVDLVICNYFNNNTPKENHFITSAQEGGIRDRICTMREFVNPKSFKGFAWNKLYKLKIIAENQLWYDLDCVLVEDALFNHQYMFHCNTSYFVNKPLYHYITRRDSLTNQQFKDKNWKLLDSYQTIVQFCASQNDKTLNSLLEQNYLSHEVTILKKIYFSKHKVEKSRVEKVKNDLKHDLKSLLGATNITLKRKVLAIFLMCISYKRLYCD